ncbi:Valine--pyruvate aminotransferase, partial [Elasticomyces elasticus]
MNKHSKPLVNLIRGWPSTSLLPISQIAAAAQAVLSEPSIAYPGLLYGPDEGHEPLRREIAKWLTDFYEPAKPINYERICITGGASQNLGSMLQVFTDPTYTRNIWIVVPAYFLAFRIFEDNGFAGKMRAVPEDEDGIDINYLEREMKKSDDEAEKGGMMKPTLKSNRKTYRHIIYCVPTFANPSSRTMPLGRRRDLVRCARKFDAL